MKTLKHIASRLARDVSNLCFGLVVYHYVFKQVWRNRHANRKAP